MQADEHPFASTLPRGWFQVAYSDELAPLQVVPLRYLGKDLVLFRAQGGQARVLDAHCPHLGAHLGHGGTVDGEDIRCPFHGWCFAADGACTRIPYARKIPKGAVMRSWPVCESGGAIMLYHRTVGEEQPPPLPLVPELDDPDWRGIGRFRWQYPSHLQEMVDNAADPMHLIHLHGGIAPALCEVMEAGADLRIETRFTTNPARFGFPGDAVPARIDAILHGPALQVIRFSAIAEGLVLLRFTPIDGTLVEARMLLLMRHLGDEALTGMVAELIRRNITAQFEEDVLIWRNKVFRPQPVLCEGDGPIGKVRRWARQFYE